MVEYQGGALGASGAGAAAAAVVPAGAGAAAGAGAVWANANSGTNSAVEAQRRRALNKVGILSVRRSVMPRGVCTDHAARRPPGCRVLARSAAGAARDGGTSCPRLQHALPAPAAGAGAPGGQDREVPHDFAAASRSSGTCSVAGSG